MKLRYFDEVFFDNLYDSITDNYDKYLKKAKWIEDVYPNQNYYLESNYDFNLCDLNDSESDNAIAIYESLSFLTLSQASNPCLWVLLTHTVYYEYMTRRWVVSGDKLENDSLTKIKERYFCKNTRRGLLRNGLSRLWWAAYLSVDESEVDKYVYTRLLLSDEDLFVGLLERDFSMCKNVVVGVLKAFNAYKKNNGKMPSRETRRGLFIYLNQLGAPTLLDTLSIEDIYKETVKYISRNIK